MVRWPPLIASVWNSHRLSTDGQPVARLIYVEGCKSVVLACIPQLVSRSEHRARACPAH
jgi:hypothetical protein